MVSQSLTVQSEVMPERQELPEGFNEWLEQGRDLYARRKEIEWECADWLAVGIAQYPKQMEMVLEGLASDPIEQKKLTKAARVAATIPASNRNTALTFDHHAHVADLPVDERVQLLDTAQRENISARALRLIAMQRRQELGIGTMLLEDPDWDYQFLQEIVRRWNRAPQHVRQEFYDMAGDANLGVIEA
jgi:hypothetical protein